MSTLTTNTEDLRTLLRNGVEIDGESEGESENNVIIGWLEADIAKHPGDWRAELPAAIALGRRILRCFNTEFADKFVQTNGDGAKWVRDELTKRLGFTPEARVDEVLYRILRKQDHIADRFRLRAQKSLFDPETFDAKHLGGYLHGVAHYETLKMQDVLLRTNAERTLAFIPMADEEPTDSIAQYGATLIDFWSASNGFPKEQQLHGIASFGLGFATQNADFAERCRVWLDETLPVWVAKRKRLANRVSSLLSKLEDLLNEGKYEEAAVVEKELQTVRAEAREHAFDLRPRPRQVQELLKNLVTASVYTLRTRRLKREVEILRERERLRREELGSLVKIPAEVLELAAEAAEHASSKPQSQRGRNVKKSVRSKRKAQMGPWRDRMVALLRQIRSVEQRAVRMPCSEVGREAIRNWAADAEDYYELGLLTGLGVGGGPGRRFGGRLEYLLRQGVSA